MEITNELLVACGCKEKLAPFLLPHFKEVCEKYSINTGARFACFLSQLAHESGTFFYTEELASGSAYEGRKDLGNINKGDGVTYKGRGFIQITGRANYTSLSKEFKVDFVKIPTLLGAKNINICTSDQMRWATMSAGWYWNTRKLNDLADKVDLSTPVTTEPNNWVFKLITRKINGGYNGLHDRISKFEKIRKYLIK